MLNCQPHVQQRPRCGEPLVRPRGQQPEDEATRLGREFLEGAFAAIALKDEYGVLGACSRVLLRAALCRPSVQKRVDRREHQVHDDAATVQIAKLVVVPREHLRCHERGRADLLRQRQLPVPVHGAHTARTPGRPREAAGQPKVRQLHARRWESLLREGLPEEKVLRLDVAMADQVLVQVADALQELLHEQHRLVLRQAHPSRHQGLLQGGATTELEHQADGFPVLKGLVESQDAGVLQGKHQIDLDLDFLDAPLHGAGPRFRDALDGPRLPRGPRSGPKDAAVGALAKLLPELVEVLDLARRRGVGDP
mmetsp:Transcript_102091/g.292961  ORF Transcript_102091/g.292961 Transcript_102091/m.292961 type:complete len:309 (+) Transcript_102091:258-1184(+)